LVINASKTEAAYFSQRELLNPPSVNIDAIQIELMKTRSVLGLKLDYKLLWDVQVEKNPEKSKKQNSKNRTYPPTSF
jgi:hypothetical protein